MVALLIGLPLLTAYYSVNPAFYLDVVIPYVIVSVIITLLIIRRSQGKVATGGIPSYTKFAKSTLISRFNSFSVYYVMGIVSLTVLIFGALRFLIFHYYPSSPPQVGNLLGGSYYPADLLSTAYLLLLALSCILVAGRLIFSAFPVLLRIFKVRKYVLMGVLMSLSFAFVYLLLVNFILIQGLNTTSGVADVPPPDAPYPFIHVFTVGIQQPFLNLVYIPYATVQLSPELNLLVVPFEVVFVVALSFLVASNVVMAHYLISNSGLACSTKGALLSTGGSILGLTATCPTCLAPTFISVIFGGVVAAEAVYSNIYGVILPPVLSIATLLVSLVYLSRQLKKRTEITIPALT